MGSSGDEVGDLLERRRAGRNGLCEGGSRALMALASASARPLEAELSHVRALSETLVGAPGLAEILIGADDVKDVVDDLKEHAQLTREVVEEANCVSFAAPVQK